MDQLNKVTEVGNCKAMTSPATKIIVADIGGTHARFAIAHIADGNISDLTDKVTLQSIEHASLQNAWEEYGERLGRDLPNQGAIAVAAPVAGEEINFTNSNWIIRPAEISEQLGLDQHVLINDFGAVGHAVVSLGEDMFRHICGPDQTLTDDGIISVVGPGTGLGVTHVLRMSQDYHVTETEGGHLGFAPLDEIEDKLLDILRQQHRRVSVERITSGPGLAIIYQALSKLEKQPAKDLDDKAMWELALSGKDSIAAAALDRFCMCFGSVAGDLALAQGAKSVVIAGGLGQRIAHRLPSSGFCERFVAKGRFKSLMEGITVKQLVHDEPGLFGAAAAFMKANT